MHLDATPTYAQLHPDAKHPHAQLHPVSDASRIRVYKCTAASGKTHAQLHPNATHHSSQMHMYPDATHYSSNMHSCTRTKHTYMHGCTRTQHTIPPTCTAALGRNTIQYAHSQMYMPKLYPHLAYVRTTPSPSYPPNTP
nr:hypothetical protein BgiMline_026494 [Biomphalaria glabrata]